MCYDFFKIFNNVLGLHWAPEKFSIVQIYKNWINIFMLHNFSHSFVFSRLGKGLHFRLAIANEDDGSVSKI